MLSFNPKGVGVPNETLKLFDFWELMEELEFVINYVYQKFDQWDIYLVGFSLGSSYGI